MYLNLEEYSGFEELFGKSFTGTLSDLLYFVRQGDHNLTVRLNSMVETVGQLDFVPPVQSPMDIRGTPWQDWVCLIQEIVLHSSYEVLILDIGNGIDEVFQLLDLCKRIYMPVCSDGLSECKIIQFENSAASAGLSSGAGKNGKNEASVSRKYFRKRGICRAASMESAGRVRKRTDKKGKHMNRETFQAIRDLLMEKLDMSREMTDREILDEIDQLILNRMRDSYISLNEKLQLRQELFYSVRKLDVLQELIEDETVTEIMVNGPDAIFVERGGRLGKWDKSFTSREKLEDVIQQIAGRCNRVINESMPIVDARLENGARVNAVISPVALNGPILTIRRFPDTPITMDRLIALGSLTCECARFLKALVRARYSIVIGGGTGSGKTTFLGALSDYIPEDERIITIEDNAELKIQGVENLVRLEAKMANMEGAVSVSIRDLIKTASGCGRTESW